ncbi:hypothetical protein [Grimontia hollisae]|uniref:hypothetical protein n=1 Tax=Grimontia hollisae TaxID=673 RepID=UPI000E207916|nr:hypothetical protein [Grimontia hollisae]
MRLNVLAVCLLLTLSTPANAITKIDSKDAAFHEGQDVIACGELKQITRFNEYSGEVEHRFRLNVNT